MLLLMLLQLPTNFAIPYNSRRIFFSPSCNFVYIVYLPPIECTTRRWVLFYTA